MAKDTTPRGGRWRYRGLGILKGERPGGESPHLPGLDPAAAEALAREGAARIRSGGAPIHPFGSDEAMTSAEVMFVARGKARFRWGPHGEFMSEAEAGDFVYAPPDSLYRLFNAAPGRPLDCLRVARDGAVAPVPVADARETGDEVLWVDPLREAR